MEKKVIKGKAHYLYHNIENFEKAYSDYGKLNNWRLGDTGEWVLTDDNCIVQILKRGMCVGEQHYVRTICGSYLVEAKKEMYGQIAENIYTFSGTNEYKRFLKKSNYTPKEVLFAQYVATGDDPVDAYLRTYKTNNKEYAKQMSGRLLKTERIQKMIKEEIKDVLAEEGVSANYIIRRIKQVCDGGERDSDVLRALDSLAKISGLYDAGTSKQQLTVWGGFTPEQIESIKGNQVLLHGEVEDG